MDADIVSQLHWRYLRLMSGEKPMPRDGQPAPSAFSRLLARRNDTLRETRWFEVSEWFLAMLQLCRVAGIASIDAAQYSVVEEAAGNMLRARVPERRATWRLGLVRDLVASDDHASFDRVDAEFQSQAANVLGEYLAVVDEFFDSDAGRAFLTWAARSESRDARWQRLRAQVLLRSAQGEGRRRRLVVEGAEKFMHLVENVFDLLTETPEGSATRAACWVMHADFFASRQSFLLALQALKLSVFSPDAGPALFEPDETPTDSELRGLLQDRTERLLEVQRKWRDLSDPERWAPHAKRVHWYEIQKQVERLALQSQPIG